MSVWVTPWDARDSGLGSTASLKAALLAFKKDRIAWIRRLRYYQFTPQSHALSMLNSFRKYSGWLHFHLLLRQVCENNLLQPNLFINFPLIFFKTHTKDRCLGKSHQKKGREMVELGNFSKRFLLLCLQALFIIFRASFA